MKLTQPERDAFRKEIDRQKAITRRGLRWLRWLSIASLSNGALLIMVASGGWLELGADTTVWLISALGFLVAAGIGQALRVAGRGRVVSVAALATAVVLLPASELVRLSSGWPRNPEFTVLVAGPGDTVRLMMPTNVTSIWGYWSGEVDVRVLNELPRGAAHLFHGDTSGQGPWGSIMHVPEESRSKSVRPWVDIHVPAEAALAGNEVHLLVRLVVTYPYAGGYSYTEKRVHVERTVTLILAPPGAGALYQKIWGWSLLLGVLIIAGVALINWRIAKTSL